jgi:site-specific recombinase XerD
MKEQTEAPAVVHYAEILKVPMKKSIKADITDYVSENAINSILEQPNPLTRKGLRDQFIMLLMYDTAARAQY